MGKKYGMWQKISGELEGSSAYIGLEGVGECLAVPAVPGVAVAICNLPKDCADVSECMKPDS